MRQEIVAHAVGSLFLFLVLGLIYTQILHYEAYYTQSQDNFIRIMPIEGPRGRILDRNGQVLVDSRLSLDVSCVYQEMGSREPFVAALSGALKMTPSEVASAIEKAKRDPYAPVTIAEDVSKETAIALEELEPGLRGVVIESRSRRSYPYGDVAAHLVGYLGVINEGEFARLKEYGYRMRDLIGRSGLERSFNSYLTGADGGEQVEVDSSGRRLSILGLKEPVPGNDLALTIDVRLQALADELLDTKTGVVVAMDPRDGQILALASHPAFDPNIFVQSSQSAGRLKLLKDRARPFLNRATSGLYAPGSVFKIVTAAAALEMKKVSAGTSFTCNGRYLLGSTSFPCWREGGHGVQDLVDALTHSCNVYFYNVGRRVGVDGIESYATRFGYGRPSGIDLPEEASGLVPGRLWKMIAKKEGWYEGETLHYAIGQGYLTVTPLQVLDMIACIANGGRLVRPYVVTRIGAVEVGGVRRQDIGIARSTVNAIRDGMYGVVNDETGTGRRAKVDGLSICGKTGTAQNTHGIPHAWFAGFAPSDDPKIAIVVLVEHGGKGGAEPAGIAREIFTKAKEIGYL